MAIQKIILLLLAITGSTTAQVRAPAKINICYPVGNNTYTTATVISTQVSNYPGYVKGACSKICTTLCQDFPSRKVNTAGQCICVGTPLKCGANAKPANDKKSCKCMVGYKGDPIKGCTDLNECNSAKSPCAANEVCANTVGSFVCGKCGANTVVAMNQCKCKDGFEGDAVAGCTDIDECITDGGHQDCKNVGKVCVNDLNKPNQFECVRRCYTNPCRKHEKCVEFEEEDQCVRMCSSRAIYNITEDTCTCWEGAVGNPYRACYPCNGGEVIDGQCKCFPGFNLEFDPEDGDYDCLSICSNKATYDKATSTCSCQEGWFGNPYGDQCYQCGENAELVDGRCKCLDGFDFGNFYTHRDQYDCY